MEVRFGKHDRFWRSDSGARFDVRNGDASSKSKTSRHGPATTFQLHRKLPAAPCDDCTDLVRSLYATHRPALLRFLSKRTNCAQEAEDMSQEVFIRLLNLKDVERIRDNARNFMYQVAANIACDNFRRAKVRRKNFPCSHLRLLPRRGYAIAGARTGNCAEHGRDRRYIEHTAPTRAARFPAAFRKRPYLR